MGFFGVQAGFEGLEKGNVCFVDRGCRNEDRVGCVVLSALGSLVEPMELTLLLPVVRRSVAQEVKMTVQDRAYTSPIWYTP